MRDCYTKQVTAAESCHVQEGFVSGLKLHVRWSLVFDSPFVVLLRGGFESAAPLRFAYPFLDLFSGRCACSLRWDLLKVPCCTAMFLQQPREGNTGSREGNTGSREGISHYYIEVAA